MLVCRAGFVANPFWITTDGQISAIYTWLTRSELARCSYWSINNLYPMYPIVSRRISWLTFNRFQSNMAVIVYNQSQSIIYCRRQQWKNRVPLKYAVKICGSVDNNDLYIGEFSRSFMICPLRKDKQSLINEWLIYLMRMNFVQMLVLACASTGSKRITLIFTNTTNLVATIS